MCVEIAGLSTESAELKGEESREITCLWACGDKMPIVAIFVNLCHPSILAAILARQ